MAELIFLGTGTSQGVPVIGCGCAVCTSTDPRDQRTRSSVLMRAEGVTLLIDGGPDMRQQLLREKVDKLDAVLLTHEHMDHIAGLDDLRAFTFAQNPPKAVPVYGTERTLEAMRRVFAYAFSGNGYPGMPKFDLHEIGKEPFKVSGLHVQPVEVLHMRMPVLGFRIGGMAYITDAKTIAPEERDKLRDLDVLVLNALRKEPHISHFNLEEALDMIEDLKPRRAFLTHISHYMGKHADVQLPPQVHLAYDGLRVEV
ncbi:MAG: MBL fold metallo-hydrolase [Flavobacteriales bacterium]|jgi:phosphoribosyl 1,2-cyclic phosphate phosphodiesterase|nr:MBL fold metallo-hydrolase [Flavobacteriales bacterium]MBP9159640.1 MBL fold metallo-hydrolase [Flavobacteriales bacterium]MCI1753533.1 MBL fold metallo-hydrolase [Flavobacteriales bacterium]